MIQHSILLFKQAINSYLETINNDLQTGYTLSYQYTHIEVYHQEYQELSRIFFINNQVSISSSNNIQLDQITHAVIDHPLFESLVPVMNFVINAQANIYHQINKANEETGYITKIEQALNNNKEQFIDRTFIDLAGDDTFIIDDINIPNNQVYIRYGNDIRKNDEWEYKEYYQQKITINECVKLLADNEEIMYKFSSNRKFKIKRFINNGGEDSIQ